MASRVVNMTVPEELLKEADQVAQAEGYSRSELFREALRRYLQQRRPAGKNAAPLLGRLAGLATKGPNVSAKEIDALVYGKKRR